ncbi:aminotransferase class V-fold PLP-dependent enzyme [Pseudarthrobacter psychrotolerans]|uniref:Aminotransferase class V-fold PLP-dependent enzyme n=1 Tax=Pseudarthrobacter psychrotolerans TaxID=2697569 RepID=A0A6P1NJA1_9MICC|nr:aminotransferase class V-fold PLP-dependent enzyme [Pseudarthrobacter psychrotolerans]QHK18540.1 aminotransferase class V-fold PLP-dependent enzyme [Pseudarthrobacter psychrotolerans]
MSFYSDLGLKPVINAATTFTALGGSLMPEEVLEAMRDAAGSFVDMHDLHLAAGKRLAELTRNDAAYATSGCAAALVLALLGIRSKGDPRVLREFPGRDLAPSEVIMHAAHRIPYDAAIAMSGVTIRQIGNIQQTFDWELEAAITEKTAAVLYVAGSHLPQVALPLSEVVRIAKSRGVPVIVDAAAQLPPMENLWHFTREAGADVAVFSGGKALRGPQASGLMVGNAEIIEAARQNGAPFQRWARAMKAGKEEVAGLVAAVERFINLDHAALHGQWLATVDAWREGLRGLDGVSPHAELLNEAGQPVPRLYVGMTDSGRAARALAELEGASPRVAVLPDLRNGTAHGFWIGPDLLQDGEAQIVQDAVRSAITN